MNQKKSGFFTARNVATLGILLALVIVLQAFATAIQSVTVVNLNLSLVPIAIGAIVLGAWAGAVLGFACGVVVLIQVMIGGNFFYTTIWTYSPVITTLICLFKTTVAGYVAGLLFHPIAKKNKYVATFVSSGIVPVVNTALFILGCLCMPEAMQVVQGASTMNIFVFIVVGIVTWNFFIEFAISLFLAPALYRVYLVIEKKFKR